MRKAFRKALAAAAAAACCCFMLAAKDTMRCFRASYSAEAAPHFEQRSDINASGESGASWCALVGTLVIEVNRAKSYDYDGNVSTPANDDSSFLSALYFRDIEEGKNKATLSISGGGTAEARLYTRIASAASSATVLNQACVDISDPSNFATGRDDVFRHLLPAFYRNGAACVWSPGSRNGSDEWLQTMTLEFWLKITANGSACEGRTVSVDPLLSSFSSMSTLAFCHNYNPSRYGGSICPADSLGGDLSFFPSANYTKSMPVGEQPDPAEVQCWVLFEKTQTDFSSIPEGDAELGAFSVLLSGPSVDGRSDCSIEYSMTGLHSAEGSEEFRIVRTDGKGTYDERSYVTYRLTFRGSPVVSGRTETWPGLHGGGSNSPYNRAALTATGFDGSSAELPGLYSDTVTLEVTAVN